MNYSISNALGRSSALNSYDADSLAYFTLAGITNYTAKVVIDRTIKAFKADGWWSGLVFTPFRYSLYSFGGAASATPHSIGPPSALPAAPVKDANGYTFAPELPTTRKDTVGTGGILEEAIESSLSLPYMRLILSSTERTGAIPSGMATMGYNTVYQSNEVSFGRYGSTPFGPSAPNYTGGIALDWQSSTQVDGEKSMFNAAIDASGGWQNVAVRNRQRPHLFGWQFPASLATQARTMWGQLVADRTITAYTSVRRAEKIMLFPSDFRTGALGTVYASMRYHGTMPDIKVCRRLQNLLDTTYLADIHGNLPIWMIAGQSNASPTLCGFLYNEMNPYGTGGLARQAFCHGYHGGQEIGKWTSNISGAVTSTTYTGVTPIRGKWYNYDFKNSGGATAGFNSESQAWYEQHLPTGTTQKIIVWFQGESDTSYDSWASEYQGQLEFLVAAWKTDFPNCRIVLIKPYWESTASGATQARYATVRAAYDTVAAADTSKILLMDSQSYSRDAGDVHLNTAGQTALATAIKAAYNAKWP